jgi:ATP-dependent DNA helicase RecG
MRRRVLVETGASDVTAFPLELEPETAISPAAMERLREAACAEGAPGDLTGQADRDLLASLGVLRSGRLTVAGLLLAGRAEVVRARVPGYRWTWLRMTSDVEYDDRLDGTDAIPEALWKLDQRIEANNPLETVRQGLFHFEHRTWPRIALREALLNAFCHLDLSLGAPVTIRQYTRAADEPFSGPRLEIMNPGGFVGGITPANILHHPPVPRNPALVEALLKLRLVNRSSLGIQRMFAAFLEQGKRPPAVHEAGDAVRVTFLASPFSPAFRSFIEEEHQAGRPLGVDALLVVHALLQAEELDSAEVAALCQRSPAETRALLAELSASRGYLEGGSGRGTWWRLGVRLRERLGGRAGTRVHLNREVAKERILAALAEGAEDGARPLGNQDLRHLLRLTRAQVLSLVQELQCEERLVIEGRGRGARYLPKGR